MLTQSFFINNAWQDKKLLKFLLKLFHSTQKFITCKFTYESESSAKYFYWAPSDHKCNYENNLFLISQSNIMLTPSQKSNNWVNKQVRQQANQETKNELTHSEQGSKKWGKREEGQSSDQTNKCKKSSIILLYHIPPFYTFCCSFPWSSALCCWNSSFDLLEKTQINSINQ